MSGTLHVVAILKAQDGKEEELGNVLRALLEPTRAESGCISYHLHTNADAPGEYVFIEEWRDGAALEAHLATPHIQAAIAAFPELLAEELDLRSLSRVG